MGVFPWGWEGRLLGKAPLAVSSLAAVYIASICMYLLVQNIFINMLCLSVLTFVMAALVSAAPPPKKDKNQFTIRPIAQQDKCLDVEPAPGESVGYALV